MTTTTSTQHASPHTEPAPEADGRTKPSATAARRLVRHALLPLAATLLIAVVVSRGVELVYVQTEPWLEPAERWASFPLRLHVLGSLVVWPFVAVLLAVTGSLAATAILSVAAGGVVAVAAHQKMTHRGEPLFPSDVDYLADSGLMLASAGISPVLAVGAVLVVGAALAGVAVLAWRRRSARPRGERWWRRGARVAFGAAGVVGIVVVGGFHDPGNPLRQAYEGIPLTWAEWNQVQNYAQNGFVAGALYNLPGQAMERPEGYSEERLAQVTERYAGLAEQANASRAGGALGDANVVIILGEAFTDPTWLSGVEIVEDPIPFTRSLMAEHPSGRMLSSGFGGGTANVEFEVLTGMALANFQPQMHAPYPLLVPRYDHFPSFVHSVGTERGTLAVHPYAPGFYRRETVYPVLGFERATFWDTIGHRDKIGNDAHISDAATYREVLDELRDSPEPLLVNVVTMQNHSPHAGNFPDPIGVTGPFDDTKAEEVGQYLRGLRHSDDAMAELVGELEDFEEPTVVLFYGDHLPAVWPRGVQDANSDQQLRETPWFVWSNTGTVDTAPPPVLGPNHLVPQLLAATGAPLSPYAALLTELSEEIAADEAGIMLDAQGRPLDADDLSPRARELLTDYRLVQYDLSVGERYAAQAMFAVP